jgi:hypothetical protein
MNTFSPATLTLSMQTGSGPLSHMEAAKFAAYLSDELPKTQPVDQHVILNLIHGLRELPKPEAAFGDIYRPLGYQPGWVADP